MSRQTSVAPSKAETTEILFEPMRMGRMTLPHRVAMAPLTRSRARQPGNVPTPLNAAYYVQRSSAALIISEATQISMQGQGYAWTPGIHSREQIEGWRLVTHAVHAAGGGNPAFSISGECVPTFSTDVEARRHRRSKLNAQLVPLRRR